MDTDKNSTLKLSKIEDAPDFKYLSLFSREKYYDEAFYEYFKTSVWNTLEGNVNEISRDKQVWKIESTTDENNILSKYKVSDVITWYINNSDNSDIYKEEDNLVRIECSKFAEWTPGQWNYYWWRDPLIRLFRKKDNKEIIVMYFLNSSSMSYDWNINTHLSISYCPNWFQSNIISAYLQQPDSIIFGKKITKENFIFVNLNTSSSAEVYNSAYSSREKLILIIDVKNATARCISDTYSDTTW